MCVSLFEEGHIWIVKWEWCSDLICEVSTIFWQSRSAAPAQSSWVSGWASCCCCCSACWLSARRETSDEGADFWKPRASELGRGWQRLCSFPGTLVGKQQRDQFTANAFSLTSSPGLCFLYPWSRSRPRLQSAGCQTPFLAGVWRPHRSCSRCDAYSFSAVGWNLSPVRQKKKI